MAGLTRVRNRLRISKKNSDLPPLLDMDVDELAARLVQEAVRRGLLAPGDQVTIELSTGARAFVTVADVVRRL